MDKKTMIEHNMTCANDCSNKQMCFMLSPYFTCGRDMCFDTRIAINWCIQCGCKSKHNEACNRAFNICCERPFFLY